MDISSETFCVLPFIHKHQRLSGDETVCCISPIPLKKGDILTVQSKLLEGKKIIHCDRCWGFEKNNIESARQRENKRWLADPDVREYLENYVIGDKMKTFSYDLRYSNICNLACIGCMPENSSLWAKELNVDCPSVEATFDEDEIVNSKYVYFAGGEPFLTDKMISLLERISKQDVQPSICINTNLTIQNEQVMELCSKLKSLNLHISIDGTNSVAEYHRWPIKWNKFERNLKWAKQLGCRLTFNTVVDAVNVSFIHQIMDYEEYTSNWGLIPIVTPKALQIKNLPENLKNLAYDNFSKLRNSNSYRTNDSFKNKVETILSGINDNGDAMLLSTFISQLDARRNINHIDYLGIKLTH